MAFFDATAQTPATSRPNIFARAALAVWNGLIAMGEASSYARAIRQLNEMSDEELAKQGMTRADAAKRIFADVYYL